MSFLQPLFLALLPLIALPVVIHLINRRRHRTLPWAAMMFLRDARQMSRGMARLRHLLILAARVLAVAGLIFAVSRPLVTAGGHWLGGTVDTVFVLLDRSASMAQMDVAIGQSKRRNGLAKIVDYLGDVGQPNQVVLVASGSNRAVPVESLAHLTELPYVRATAASADIPAMLQTVQRYMTDNQTGSAQVWVVSDFRESDWAPGSGRWAAIRKAFGGMPSVEFRLLAYDQSPNDNIAVRVDHVRRQESVSNQQGELVLDVHLKRTGKAAGPTRIPIEFVINGARTVLTVNMTNAEHLVQGFALPLDKRLERGWGWVELPADANLADNLFYFVFAKEPQRHTVIVAEDPLAAARLQRAVTAPPDSSVQVSATVVASDRIGEVDWGRTAMLLWQGPLPAGRAARRIEQFVSSGRPVLFFPPNSADAAGTAGAEELFGVRWGQWRSVAANRPAQHVANWRNDVGLLTHADSGTALPVGDLQVSRYRAIEGDCNVLASLQDGTALLTRVATQGPEAVYFCATLPQAGYSTLARDGVVFYVMLQRALAVGAASISGARQLDAGPRAGQEIADCKPLQIGRAGREGTPTLGPNPQLQAGVFASDDALVALNRPAGEDVAKTVSANRIDRLFAGTNCYQIRQRLDGSGPLAREIWKALLVVMLFALLAEALLCMPQSGGVERGRTPRGMQTADPQFTRPASRDIGHTEAIV